MISNTIEFNKLAIEHPDDLLFGKSKYPVSCGNGLTIGNGQVIPEINFTLPTMTIEKSTWKDVITHYTEIAEALCRRAGALSIPGLVVEFEELPPMTEHSEWGAEITSLLKNSLNNLTDQTGIPTALRVTVVDLRDGERPPVLRSGKYWELTKKAFMEAAKAGADILSIESVGGKEVHDQALMYGDLAGMVTSLGSLAWRDMGWLWTEISAIAKEYGIIPGGDTACGFANTAMQLSGQKMIPSLMAALDRAASVPRSLAAYEHGAVGPSKDCAYEGPVIKAITGFPISMEGKSSCCAHFSPLGNIAGAAADLWSNESVQNIRLLSGSAPEAFLELLSYDCRLFNTAISKGEELKLRNWMVESDVQHSVEALMLDPEVVYELAKATISKENGYERTVAVTQRAFDLINESINQGKISLPDTEHKWLSKLGKVIENLPDYEAEALDILMSEYGTFVNKDSYDL